MIPTLSCNIFQAIMVMELTQAKLTVSLAKQVKHLVMATEVVMQRDLLVMADNHTINILLTLIARMSMRIRMDISTAI